MLLFYVLPYLVMFTPVPSLCYKSTLLNLTMCNNPEPAMDPNRHRKVIGEAEAYKDKGKTLIRGNITVFKDTVALARFRAGVLDGRRPFKYVIDYGGLSCKNILFKLIMRASKVKLDPKTCAVLAGNYVFNNFDLSKVERLTNIVPIREPGLNVWYFGLYGDKADVIEMVQSTYSYDL